MNNQQITKIINYFRINHNFHSPFTLIVDGNFLKILVEKDIDLQQRLKPLLPGKIKVRMTQCTVQELGMLGHDFAIIYKKAKQIQHLKCSHTFETVDRCILDHSHKEESLIVCSQDKILRRKLRNKNVGIMYFGPDQRITMEDIQRHQYKNMKQMQREKFMPAENERQELQQYHEQEKTLEKIKNRKTEFRMASARGVQLKYLKKKVVKGPNPLSMKKKSNKFHGKFDNNHHNESNNLEHNENNQSHSQNQKKKRIRKRNKNKNKDQTNIQNQTDQNS